MSKLKRAVNIFLSICVIAFLVIAVFINSNTTYRQPGFSVEFSNNWSEFKNGQTKPISMPYDFEQTKITITNTLPHMHENSVLLVKCNYKELYAKVDGKTVYKSDLASFGPLKSDVGHFIALIPLEAKHSDQPIELTITERDSKYHSSIKYINITTLSAYSTIPMQIVTLLGFVMLFVTAALGVWALVDKIIGRAIEGMTTVILVTIFIGSIMMISLGIIGYYVARIYEEIKGRPKYIISESCESKKTALKNKGER